MTVDPHTGLVLWQPATGDIGSQNVDIRLTNQRGASIEQTFTLTVVPDTTPPSVSVTLSQPFVNPGQTVTIQVKASDDVAVASMSLTVDGTPLTLDANGKATYTATTSGLIAVIATATDPSGNVGTASTQLRVIDPSDTTSPTVQITSLESGDTISYLTQITGTISDPYFDYYRIDYAPAGSNDWTLLTQSNTPVINGVLGTFDPTLLQNGPYTIRITAQNVNGLQTIREINVNLTGNAKIGNFREQFTDLQVPLAGIPITITRTYDTLQANQLGDFGYGWSLSLGDPHIFETVPVTDSLGDPFGATPFRAGTKVYLTNADGVREGFTFTPTPEAGLLGTIWHPEFTPDPGVYDTLSVHDVALEQYPDGTFRLYLVGFAYNPEDFTLTTKDGLSYRYDKFTGLQSVTDRNGNSLTVTANGITSSTGQSIQFVRDAEGRITQIIDPAGHAITYAYDSSMNLTEVTNQIGNESDYTYFTTLAHYLASANNATCGCAQQEPAQFLTYGLDGRLQTDSDSLGNTTTTSYNLAADTEHVQDALGNVTTIVYDQQGNVISETDPLGNTGTSAYDANNNLIARTDARGNTTQWTYDSHGNVTSITDPLGNVWSETYNSFNKPATVTDALGRVYSYAYDDHGNLTQITDPAGNVARYTYDASGRPLTSTDNNGNTTAFVYGAGPRPIAIINPDGTSSTYEYNLFGQPTKLVDENGNTTLFTYDDIGRLIQVTDPQGNTATLTYDSDNRVVAQTDSLGRVTRTAYDAAGRVIQTIDAAGGITKYQYDAAGQLIAQTDARGNVTTYTYQANGLLASVSQGDPSTTQYQYDANGNVIASIDPNGNRTTYAYDADNRLIKQTDSLGGTMNYAYDAVGNRISATNQDGYTTYYAYDALNQVVKVTDPLGGATQYTYDRNGNETSFADANGNTTTYVYDSQNRLVQTINALGGVQQFAYDAVGNLIASTDELGRTTRYAYSSVNQLVSQTNPLGNQSTYAYDAVGNLIASTDALGRTTKYSYDSLNRLIATTDPANNVTTNQYDAVGNLITTTDPVGQTTSYTYDSQNRLTSVTAPDGGVTSYAYDADGNLLSATDPLNRTTVNSYDALNRLVSVTDANGGVTRYGYDAVGNQTSITDPLNQTSTYVYDALNRVVQYTDPLGHSAYFGYDAVGNQTSVVDRDGRQRTFTYDSLNRQTSELWWSGASIINTINYSYDAAGNLLTASDSQSQYAFAYDPLNRVVSVDDAGTPGVPHSVLSYAYDAVGNVISVNDNFGAQVTSTYDARDLLTSRSWQGAGIAPTQVSFRYDAAGQTTDIDRFSGDSSTPVSKSLYQYDPVGRITDIQQQGAGGTVVASYHLTYDVGGELTGETDNGNVSTFSYDTNGQETAVSHSAQPNEAYHYDAAGNRTGGGYQIGGNDQVLSDGTYNYKYDNEGNLIQKTNIATGDVTTYRYDYRNRLTDVVENNAAGTVLHSAHYVYDVFDRRIGKIVDGVAASTMYNGAQAWADFAANGTVLARYLYGDGVDQILARYRPSDGVAWYLTDQQGSIRDLVNASGVRIDHLDYDSFGNIITEADSAAADRFKYTGREFDAETGLYYYRGRYYSPEIGRFISQDPLGFAAGDINLYRYVGNSPANGTDPSGEGIVGNAVFRGAIVGAITGAALGLVCGASRAWAEGGDASDIMIEGVKGAGYGGLLGGFIGALGGFLVGNTAAAAAVATTPAEVAAVGANAVALENLSTGLTGIGGISMIVYVAQSKNGKELIASGTCAAGGLIAPYAVRKFFPGVPQSASEELAKVRGQIASQIEEVARRRSLGTDPRRGYLSHEEAAALNLEQQKGINLRRDPTGNADWIGPNNKTYDLLGPFPKQHLEGQVRNGNLLEAFKEHTTGVKTDFAVVDFSGLDSAAVQQVEGVISLLSPAQQARIISLNK